MSPPRSGCAPAVDQHAESSSRATNSPQGLLLVSAQPRQGGHRGRTGAAGSAAVALCICAFSSGSLAQGVTLAGSMGNKALLVIDGRPHTLAPGQSAAGVTLLQFADGQALVQRGGSTASLQLGAAPARLSGTPNAPTGAQEIVLPVGLGGHFTAAGAINGRAVQFMVDTGATVVAISQTEAERIGLAWRDAPRAVTQTANGAVPVHRVSLNAVRLGEVEVNNVEAIVMPAQMPYVLLGNSYLGRFQMRRDNDQLRLERRR
jgi:aspartyl protease family protein